MLVSSVKFNSLFLAISRSLFFLFSSKALPKTHSAARRQSLPPLKALTKLFTKCVPCANQPCWTSASSGECQTQRPFGSSAVTAWDQVRSASCRGHAPRRLSSFSSRFCLPAQSSPCSSAAYMSSQVQRPAPNCWAVTSQFHPGRATFLLILESYRYISILFHKVHFFKAIHDFENR